MNRNLSLLLGVVAICIWLGVAFSVNAQTKLWVSSKGAKLKVEKSAAADTIETIAVGTEVILLVKDNKWYQVETGGGKQGWVYRGKLSTEPPQTEKSDDGVGDLFGAMAGSSIESDSADSARSIRGLSPEAKAYADNTAAPEAYKKALDNMLALTVEHSALEQFLKNGKIGEYAE